MKTFIKLLITINLLICTSVISKSKEFDRGNFKLSGNYFTQVYNRDSYVFNPSSSISLSASIAIKKGFFVGLSTFKENYQKIGNIENWNIGPVFEFYAPSYNQSGNQKRIVVPYFKLMLSKGEYVRENYLNIRLNVGFLKMLSNPFGLDLAMSYSFKIIKSDNYYIENKTAHQLMLGIGFSSLMSK